jgi:hypothetical protein
MFLLSIEQAGKKAFYHDFTFSPPYTLENKITLTYFKYHIPNIINLLP